MNPLRRFLQGLAPLFRRAALEQEMDEEMRFHLEMETERNRARGLSPREAHCAALRSFGGLEQLKERERDARGWRWWDEILGDARFALRQLRKNPGFAFTAVLTLAIGIGATTAIFSVVHALLLHPLNYPAAERIMQVSEAPPNGLGGSCGGSFSDWFANQQHFEKLAALHTISKPLTGRGEPVQLSGWEVTSEFLSVFGIKPQIGRDFTAEDDSPGGNSQVAIITAEFWNARLQGDPEVLGEFLTLDGSGYEIIGILPPEALLSPDVDYLSPANIHGAAYKTDRNFGYVTNTYGRLKPGATAEQAATQLSAVKESLNHLYPGYKESWRVDVTSLQESLFGNARQPLVILLCSVAAVLLIACVNVANLLLARTTTREGEIALRLAVGATRGRILRQMLTESLVLAGLGGLLGLGLGALAIDPLVSFTGANQVQAIEVGLNPGVLSVALATTLGTGLVFGLLPALRASKPHVNEQLKDGMRGATSGKRRSLQSVLIVAETALTVMLLVTAGLLLRSLIKVATAETGFEPEGVLTFQIAQSGNTAETIEQRSRFTDAVLAELATLPGVRSVGMASCLPMNGSQFFGDTIYRADRPETENAQGTGFDAVAGDYFQTLGIPLLAGRLLDPRDNLADAPPVMVVSEAFVDQFFDEGENPIGTQLVFKGDHFEIVGVVGGIRRFTMDNPPPPQVYFAQRFFPWHTHYVVRTEVPPYTLGQSVREAVQRVHPDQPIAHLGTLADSARRTLSGRIAMLSLIGLFAVVALLLACVGTYGVMAYSVNQRVREMGIRVALGATPESILNLVLRDGVKLILAGLVLGAIAAAFSSRALAAQLYGIGRGDPLVFIGVSVMLLVVGAAACFLPARRATKIDPLEALRVQ